MREVRVQDTLSGEPRPLERESEPLGIYACGPTVYARVHVGNARPFVVFALLKRFLEHEGLDVTLVANITDVNDKIYDAARERGVHSEELAREMTATYRQDTDRLENLSIGMSVEIHLRRDVPGITLLGFMVIPE